MSNDLILLENTATQRLPISLAAQGFADQAREYASHARSASTRKAYGSDVRAFEAWCEANNACAMPAGSATVLAYLIDKAQTLKVASLRRCLVAIREHHGAAGHVLDLTSPAFRDAWVGIQRDHGQPADKKRPLLTAELRRAVAALPDTLAGRRDRALILVGFAAALRRSELAALEVARCDGGGWIEETADGLVVHLARTKTDQAGVGVDVGIPYGADPSTCAVRVFRGWLKAAKLKTGPAFRAIDRNGRIRDGALSGQTVARIVKRAVEALALSEGASPKEAARRAAGYAGHSLRAGLATSAAANDAPGHAIQRQLRHKKYDTTVGYIRAGQLFKGNAASFAGL